jgi:hypothetical protein
MMSEGTETAEAIAYAAEESGNVDDSGNFSIEVEAHLACFACLFAMLSHCTPPVPPPPPPPPSVFIAPGHLPLGVPPQVLKQAVKRSHDLAITPAYIDPAVMADVWYEARCAVTHTPTPAPPATARTSI